MPSLPETRASLILRLPDAADGRAWDDFISIYAPLVYRLARRHGLQPADADEVVQEVLAAVARSVESWLARTDRGPFRAWLLRIARNIAISALTRPKLRAVGTGNSDMNRLISEHPDPNDEATSGYDLEYRREQFRLAAEQVRSEITERTWHAFQRSAIDEQPIAAVAKQLNMSVGSVYIARSRVMARLREIIKEFDSAP
jgi:RNA polymerase sigma-70 factor, ECF subfamily